MKRDKIIIKNRINKMLIMILLLTLFFYEFICLASTQNVYATQTREEYSKKISNYPGYKELIDKLKKDHPNWKFTILYTGLDWDQVIKNEAIAVHGRNVVPASKSDAWKCSICGNTPRGGSSWRCASENAVAYYMDPRNWLNDSYIFEFENLSYNSEIQTIDGVNKIISGIKYMDVDNKVTYTKTDGTKATLDKTYAQIIMDAAEEAGISPYHLASRIRQEQGTGSTPGSTATGTYGDYKGYYNFLNIKASGSTDGQVIANGLAYAKENGFDYVLLDTAGRLHIDTELMDELNNINNEVKPNEILLVVDSMTGQDAINVILGFNSSLPLTGAILTKMDGDTRGGAALSIRHLTNIPIKFVGISEKMDGIEPFYPDRIATRILGMGDIMTMIEKAEEVIDQDEAMNAAKKMQSGKFDLEDFLSQMKQIRKLGPLENLIKLIPGVPKELKSVKIDPKDMAHIEAIILSMTPYERRHPEVLKATRKQRIAKGCARSVEEVNRLLKQFEQMKTMMKQFKNGNFKMPF